MGDFRKSNQLAINLTGTYFISHKISSYATTVW